MKPSYYFDHAASAPRRDEVADAMARWQHGVVGNPSGSHRAAREARRAIEEARDEVAAFVGAAPSGVVFTGGGTESCHLAIAGAAGTHHRSHARTLILTSPVEHHAVLDAATKMTREWPTVEHVTLAVDERGVVEPTSLDPFLGDDVAVVSVMSANNETGVVQPLEAIAARVASLAPGTLTHTDAVAAAPWLDLAVTTRNVDMISLCAHKLGGPVNAGALILRRDLVLDAVVPGGGQERGRRGGTVDVAAAVGLAAALRATARDRVADAQRVRGYQDRLVGALGALPGARVTALDAERLVGTVHLTFDGVASDELLFLLDQQGLCASAAASCSSGAATPSHVLAAMGVANERARGSLRLSMGAETSSDDVEAAIAIITAALTRLAGEG